MIDFDRAGKRAFERIDKAFPELNRDPMLDAYQRMTPRDFAVLQEAHGANKVADFILDMEKRNLGGKTNGY